MEGEKGPSGESRVLFDTILAGARTNFERTGQPGRFGKDMPGNEEDLMKGGRQEELPFSVAYLPGERKVCVDNGFLYTPKDLLSGLLNSNRLNYNGTFGVSFIYFEGYIKKTTFSVTEDQAVALMITSASILGLKTEGLIELCSLYTEKNRNNLAKYSILPTLTEKLKTLITANRTAHTKSQERTAPTDNMATELARTKAELARVTAERDSLRKQLETSRKQLETERALRAAAESRVGNTDLSKTVDISKVETLVNNLTNEQIINIFHTLKLTILKALHKDLFPKDKALGAISEEFSLIMSHIMDKVAKNRRITFK